MKTFIRGILTTVLVFTFTLIPTVIYTEKNSKSRFSRRICQRSVNRSTFCSPTSRNNGFNRRANKRNRRQITKR